MNSDELAIRLCELFDIDPARVSHVTIDCPPGEFPTVTFSCLMHGSTLDAVVEEVSRYVLRPAEEKETP